MSRALSNTLRQAINSQETAEVFLILLTIDHDDLLEPIRVSNDIVDTVSNGESFIALPFQLELPNDDENGSPRAKLTIDNVDRQIVLAVRSISTAPNMNVKIVLASDPDTIEAEFPNFKFTNISYNQLTVSGDVTVEDFMLEPFPAGNFNPSEFPGIY